MSIFSKEKICYNIDPIYTRAGVQIMCRKRTGACSAVDQSIPSPPCPIESREPSPFVAITDIVKRIRI